MLTQKQIQNLKPGDPIVIHTTFGQVDSDGDVRFLTPNSCGDDSHAYINKEYVSLPGEPVEQPKPKHDPTRLFKEGDKVRVVEWNGRHFHDRDHGTELTTGCICEVCDDEESTVTEGYINIMVTYQEQVRSIAPCFLELVTPMEELEPYSVEKDDWEYVVFDRARKVDVCRFAVAHPNAKAAAEAERDRLNKEWRKEQK
jgi:hypothetical protein